VLLRLEARTITACSGAERAACGLGACTQFLEGVGGFPQSSPAAPPLVHAGPACSGHCKNYITGSLLPECGLQQRLQPCSHRATQQVQKTLLVLFLFFFYFVKKKQKKRYLLRNTTCRSTLVLWIPGSYEDLVAAGRQRVLQAFKESGVGDIESCITDELVITPDQWAQRYGLRHGAAFGLAHGIDQLSVFR
jgi:hypothetical protein